MLHPAFVRAAQSVRSRLGLDAFLRGTEKTRVTTELNVELQDREGNVVTVAQLVVKIDGALSPRAGNTLVFVDSNEDPITGESYTLDVLIDDNGANERWVCVKA